MAGILYGVGVGPGDPQLITLKALKVIEDCDYIGIPAKDADSCTAYRIALGALPSMADKPVLAAPVPMTTDADRLNAAYEQGCLRIIEKLREKKSVAFLNLGDPTVYGSYMEIHRRVRAAGFETKVINGVPSFCAVAAALELPLGDGKEMIHILPGCYDIADMEKLEGTKVLMKSGSRIGAVKEALAVMQKAGCVKAGAVSDCGMESQRIFSDIGELPENAGYFTTIVVKDGR
ncbi:MAG: precorrin-2 C(20)-methyltransferase [Eubacteriales bacterium]|nr:precorrin-2 C(20)-methyltransferase [Eubacteriales bacterium]